jgi:thioredoxin-related protein
MNKFIPWILIALFLAIGIPNGSAFEWRTDLAAATADAKENDQLLLLNFSGSDWCGWCKRLDAEVFSQDEFKTYADSSLVPLLADFPRKSPQEKDLQAQNQRLMKHFNVQGFPTLLLFNSEGELIGQLGYQPGGPKAFIQAIEQAVARSQMAAPNAAARAKLPLE